MNRHVIFPDIDLVANGRRTIFHLLPEAGDSYEYIVATDYKSSNPWRYYLCKVVQINNVHLLDDVDEKVATACGYDTICQYLQNWDAKHISEYASVNNPIVRKYTICCIGEIQPTDFDPIGSIFELANAEIKDLEDKEVFKHLDATLQLPM